ncbi:MAG TPA: archaetidylserine decarboxylase [Longimicrobiales bacterium]
MSEPRVPDVSPELPRAHWRALLAALRRLPQGALSRGFGALADAPIPRPLRRLVLSGFARTLGIDLAEAELPLAQYGSINAFFVRRLKAGLRAWPVAPATAGSPVDGVVGQFGTISAGTLLQAKGRGYSAARLLGDAEEASRFQHGSYLTLYLSPRHYHRIHAPVAGAISKARHVPGRLLPVNAPSVAHVPELFAINERLVCYIDSALGRIAVVAVGAYNVGRIAAAFDAAWAAQGWVTNRRGAHPETRTYVPPVAVGTGAEIMAFHLGSTVVLLLEPGVRLENSLRPGAEIRLGQAIASA